MECNTSNSSHYYIVCILLFSYYCIILWKHFSKSWSILPSSWNIFNLFINIFNSFINIFNRFINIFNWFINILSRPQNIFNRFINILSGSQNIFNRFINIFYLSPKIFSTGLFWGAKLIELKIVQLFWYLKKCVKYSFLHKCCSDWHETGTVGTRISNYLTGHCDLANMTSLT